jgi:hypothetical protein
MGYNTNHGSQEVELRAHLFLVVIGANVKGQRREPATGDLRIATRRAG